MSLIDWPINYKVTYIKFRSNLNFFLEIYTTIFKLINLTSKLVIKDFLDIVAPCSITLYFWAKASFFLIVDVSWLRFCKLENEVSKRVKTLKMTFTSFQYLACTTLFMTQWLYHVRNKILWYLYVKKILHHFIT